MVKAVSTQSFEGEVIGSAVPVLVDFWAEWCGPCRMVSPIMEELSKQYEGKIQVVKVNVDENSELAGRYGVSGIPTLMFFKGGREVHRIVGAAPKSYYVKEIERIISQGS